MIVNARGAENGPLEAMPDGPLRVVQRMKYVAILPTSEPLNDDVNGAFVAVL